MMFCLYLQASYIPTQTHNMNRRQGVVKHVKEELEYMDEYDEDELEDNYNDDDWEQIQYVAQTMKVDSRTAADALEKYDFDENAAMNFILEERQREEEKLAKKEKKKLETKEKEQKAKEELLLQKKKSEIQNVRKTSSEELPIAKRKSSLYAEDYQTDHYNTDYPDQQMKKQSAPSKTVNIVVVGHVDSGKSTLVGQLMHELQLIERKQIHKNQKLSKEMGKESFKYAWVTDETDEQRMRGVTIDVGVKKITLNDKNIVFLDSPGHRDFIPNMITGAAQADYAILVIDVTHFDSTFISGGQTKQHAYIVKSLGVQTIVVAVNKMDVVEWRVDAFQTIKKKLNFYLLDIGFSEENILYVPISAFYGLNIVPGKTRQFFAGGVQYKKTFIETLSDLPLPIRPINKPLRVNITNFYDSPAGKIKGHCISGKIEGGVVHVNDKLVILPQNCQCIVKDILLGNEKVKQAVVGDNVDIQIKLIEETYFQTIKYGNVLSSLTYSIPVTNKFVMEAMALELELPIPRGTAVMAYIGSNKTTARITKIIEKYNPKTLEVIKKNCKSIRSNDCVKIEVETDEKICIEKFSNSKIFGRVILREKKSTLCVGTVTLIK